ncbi:DUF2937 family protein [Photobacterium sp. SDRW27]|uniref:DUF2937 family protein n=1 Tax=Photobacterium obscurum TaxID=2829490 RepID=UPI002244B53E|nr:DUF2937 family protein [Photobacterium obscurum]MCW8327241.1 DUF2937 family protein [Photobacterium obscurum]
MIKRLFDRLIFGGLLIATLQIPMLADHYLQYLSGFYDATTKQINAYINNAHRHGFDSAESMIDALLKENSSIVRVDAEQKQLVIQQHKELEQAITTLSTGNLIEKALFMFNPVRFDELQRVLRHFKLGIPIDFKSIVICVAIALGLNAVLYLPLILFRHGRQRITRAAPSHT